MLPGFNHNVQHQGQLFHVQTEDSGVKNPHVITHLFVGGNILASKKTEYRHLLDAADLSDQVRALMETQHKAMLRELIRGVHDGAQTTQHYHLDGPAPLNVDEETARAARPDTAPTPAPSFASATAEDSVPRASALSDEAAAKPGEGSAPNPVTLGPMPIQVPPPGAAPGQDAHGLGAPMIARPVTGITPSPSLSQTPPGGLPAALVSAPPVSAPHAGLSRPDSVPVPPAAPKLESWAAPGPTRAAQSAPIPVAPAGSGDALPLSAPVMLRADTVPVAPVVPATQLPSPPVHPAPDDALQARARQNPGFSPSLAPPRTRGAPTPLPPELAHAPTTVPRPAGTERNRVPQGIGLAPPVGVELDDEEPIELVEEVLTFGNELVTERSLDEVILSYLAEDSKG